MTDETQTIAGLAPQVKISASFNRVGNRTWFAADLITGSDYAFDFLNTYSYDGLNRITYMAQNLRGTGSQYHAVQPKSTTIAYNALGQTTFLSRYQNVNLTGDNLRTVSVYDNDTHRVTTLSNRNFGSYSVLSNYSNPWLN